MVRFIPGRNGKQARLPFGAFWKPAVRLLANVSFLIGKDPVERRGRAFTSHIHRFACGARGDNIEPGCDRSARPFLLTSPGEREVVPRLFGARFNFKSSN